MLVEVEHYLIVCGLPFRGEAAAPTLLGFSGKGYGLYRYIS